jgi:hypothetical protein
MRSKAKRILVLFGVLGVSLAIAQDVLAVVGRPLTPVSVAGVARRSVRRNTYPY